MSTTESCKVCNSVIVNRLNLFGEHQVDAFLRRIYNGTVDAHNLDYDLYIRIARALQSGVENGFGRELIRTTWGTYDFRKLSAFRENVYVFSAAKVYQQTKEMVDLLHTSTGKKPYAQFHEEASQVFNRYNEDYMSVEHQSAVAQGRSASMWKEIEEASASFDQLEYHTVGDAMVRPEHQALNGTIRPVNDKFWNVFFPPNGWNCRCTVLQCTDEQNTDMRKFPRVLYSDVPDIFRFNAGKSGYVFSPKHPYFDVPKVDKAFAKDNFGLPLPKRDI